MVKNITFFVALFRCFEVKILKYIQMNLMRPPSMGERALTELTKVTPVQMGYPPGSAGDGPQNRNWIMVLKTTAGCLPFQLFKYFLY